jgi:hypothetical protein
MCAKREEESEREKKKEIVGTMRASGRHDAERRAAAGV